jgi:hypothetical protein
VARRTLEVAVLADIGKLEQQILERARRTRRMRSLSMPRTSS